MLDSNGIRQLCYVVRIAWIAPIEGADNIELIGINGWTCIAKKGEFAEGDLAVYFEIDSKLPEDAEWAAFMAPKHFKVKTMKLGKFKVISQGLALPVSAFNNIGLKTVEVEELDGKHYIKVQDTSNGEFYKEGDFLTKRLGVTYASEEDNKRKANSSVDKYKKMTARHPELFKKPFIKWLYKKDWGKKLLFLFYGKKKDKVSWPSWVVKTDEERVENMAWILNDKTPWFATEKIDGTSTTFTLRGKGRKEEFYICSRNVVFDKPDKNCYYDTNVYVEMAEKYNMHDVLACLLGYFQNREAKPVVAVTIQGETYGASIQKRDYGMKDHDFAAFNVICYYNDGTSRRLNPREMTNLLTRNNIPCVPILNDAYILPNTIEELRAYVNSEASKIDGGMKEGIVFRSADGVRSFKCVSPEFLLRFHG